MSVFSYGYQSYISPKLNSEKKGVLKESPQHTSLAEYRINIALPWPLLLTKNNFQAKTLKKKNWTKLKKSSN